MNNERLKGILESAIHAYYRLDGGGEPEDPNDRKHFLVLQLWLEELNDNTPPPITTRHRAAIRAALGPMYAASTGCQVMVDDIERARYWLETTDKRRRKATP